MNKDTFTFGLCALVAVVLFGLALWHSDGPMSRCEDAGGQMFVGPGGETSCVSSTTFVPLDGFDGHETPK